MKAAVDEVKSKFSAYLALVEQGHCVTILRHDQPVAELRPISASLPKPRVAGSARGQIQYSADAFEPLSQREVDDFDEHPLLPGNAV